MESMTSWQHVNCFAEDADGWIVMAFSSSLWSLLRVALKCLVTQYCSLLLLYWSTSSHHIGIYYLWCILYMLDACTLFLWYPWNCFCPASGLHFLHWLLVSWLYPQGPQCPPVSHFFPCHICTPPYVIISQGISYHTCISLHCIVTLVINICGAVQLCIYIHVLMGWEIRAFYHFSGLG